MAKIPIYLGPRNALESLMSLNNSLGGNIQALTNLEQLITCYKGIKGNRDEEVTKQEELTEQESERNIVDNLVYVAGFEGVKEFKPDGNIELITKGSGSGLLITADGWIITSYSTIANYEDEWTRINEEEPPTQENMRSWFESMRNKYAIVDQDKNGYPIDPSYWATDRLHDIALIKAVTQRSPGLINFNVKKEDLEEGEIIKLFGIEEDQRLYNQHGQVILADPDAQVKYPGIGDVTHTLHDTILTDLYGVQVFNRGVFTTFNGEFAGLATQILEDRTSGGIIGNVGGTKVSHILDLVRKSVMELDSTLMNYGQPGN